MLVVDAVVTLVAEKSEQYLELGFVVDEQELLFYHGSLKL